MVKLSDSVSQVCSLLKECVDNPRFEAELIISHILNTNRLYLLTHGDEMIDDEKYCLILSYAEKRAKNMPMSYIIGYKEFMSLRFEVNESVLIPRPETEELVELILNDAPPTGARLLDLCTGSGAICCSVCYYNKSISSLGVDISEGAIDTARKNAKNLNLAKRARFIQSDILVPKSYGDKFDILVSNPPYIESSVIKTLNKTVIDFEPIIALDGGDDGLVFYKNILQNSHLYLKKGGMLYFEIGYNQGKAIKNLMKDKFKNINLIKDLSGHDRIIRAQLA